MLTAVDVGYSHTKGATDGRRVFFPSVVGEVQQTHLDLDLAVRNGYIQIETDAGTWFVGDAALEQSGLKTRRQDRGWIETPEYLALLLAAISELTTATGITIELVTGLPVSYFADRAALSERLKAVHNVKRAGRRRGQRTEITEVVILPQGLAAVLSEALDERGKIRPGPVAEGTVGLIDIGGHTVNVATFTELREIARQTASIDAGMWGPLTEIGKRINAAYPGQELRGHEIVEAVKTGTIRHYGQERDVSGIAQDVLKPFARQILAEASQVWGSAARLDVLLVAGGGAEVVGPALAAEYPHAQVVHNPQWANVEGYLRFGRRHFGV
jgi:plasmid segregation protein ParM